MVWLGNLRPRIRVPGGGAGTAKIPAAAGLRRGQAAAIPEALTPPNAKHVTSGRRGRRYPSSGRGLLALRTGHMTTRRMVYWWFRFVVSGRFIETFLNSRRAKRS